MFAGVNIVTVGQVVTLSIGYNGYHRDKIKNFFFVRYVCGSGVNNQHNFKRIGSQHKDDINCKPPCTQMTADEILTVNGQPATKDTYPIDATDSNRDG